MYRTLRNLHLSAGMFLLLFLLAYEISAVELAHRKWVPHPRWTIKEKRKLTPGITDARILAREWRGELAEVQTPPGLLKFRVTTLLGRTYDITYSISTGDTTVQTTTISFLTTLAWLHLSRGAWAVAAAILSLGLLTLGISGIYLWFKNHNERWIGGALLAAGAILTVGLIISMRYFPGP